MNKTTRTEPQGEAAASDAPVDHDRRQQLKQDCRLAARVQRSLLSGRQEFLDQIEYGIERQGDYSRRLMMLRRRLQLCSYLELRKGTDTTCWSIRHLVTEMTEQLQALQHRMLGVPAEMPTIRELLDDIRQIRREFGEYQRPKKTGTLCVSTDDIELEDVYLGSFCIQLELSSIGQPDARHSYKVIADDPQPAAGDAGITHPHVSDNRLCEGEAALAIREALRSGRLCDFFMLINQVLNTYNPQSAYVALDRWNGHSCSDCGATMQGDEANVCERCDHDVCNDCSSTCCECDRTVCHECSYDCSDCGKGICRSCSCECDDCGCALCENCRQEGRCAKCRKKLAEESEEHHEQQPESTVA